jgi:hypothetical protein
VVDLVDMGEIGRVACEFDVLYSPSKELPLQLVWDWLPEVLRAVMLWHPTPAFFAGEIQRGLRYGSTAEPPNPRYWPLLNLMVSNKTLSRCFI